MDYYLVVDRLQDPIRSKRMIQPDIFHILSKSDLNIQCPEIVFGIGDYTPGIYKMTEDFEEFKTAILKRRRLRLHSIGNFILV